MMQSIARFMRSRLLRTRTLIALLVLAVIISCIITYIFMSRRAGPPAPGNASYIMLIVVNFTLLMALIATVARRGLRLWLSLKEGSVGSRMQTRIVAMFTVVTIVPTIIVSVFSAMFFYYGIQAWFSEHVSNALDESVVVAQAYLDEHRELLRGDAIAMASDLDRAIEAHTPPSEFSRIVNDQTALRSLAEAIILQHGNIVAQSQLTFALAFERLPLDIMERAERGEVVVMFEDRDKVRALVKLKSLPDAYLRIGRFVDAKVIAHMDSANGSVKQYRELKANIGGMQRNFAIVFILLALLLLFGAVWYGMAFASRLINPIRTMVRAAERIRGGDYTVVVAEGPKDDELGSLARAFNRMAEELEKQRKGLLEAKRQIDTRRRFTEAVLSGVSAGIVALSRDKKVTLANPVAGSLLLLPAETPLVDKDFTAIVPEFSVLFERVEASLVQQIQEDITITRQDKSHVLHVRIGVERFFDVIEGYIITFDDITELLVAQRNAAWSDVARRVAHEIKNPLTPIQLSAERLRKKYLPQDAGDAESYTKYIDTITRHVSDIGKIVEEFVAFARMPAPVMRLEDISSIIRKAVFSEQTVHADIRYDFRTESPAIVLCDEQQINRLLLNILKNASEAFEHYTGVAQPHIQVDCVKENTMCKIRIQDNGPGFPADKLTRLMEPYVTTRTKGTGLGLAIVKKIIDDHKAQLSLENISEGGASVTLIFSLDSDKNVT